MSSYKLVVALLCELLCNFSECTDLTDLISMAGNQPVVCHSLVTVTMMVAHFPHSIFSFLKNMIPNFSHLSLHYAAI